MLNDLIFIPDSTKESPVGLSNTQARLRKCPWNDAISPLVLYGIPKYSKYCRSQGVCVDIVLQVLGRTASL